MQILGLIIIGIIIGVIARLVLPGRQRIGALMTVLLGIGGALVGGIVASAIGTGDIWELNILGTIVGIIAAAGPDRGRGEHGRRERRQPRRARHRSLIRYRLSQSPAAPTNSVKALTSPPWSRAPSTA